MRHLVALAFAAVLAPAALAAAGDGPIPSPYAIEIPAWFTETLLDFRDDVADAAKERKRLLLYFGQDGCPYCARLMKVNFTQPDIVATTRAGFVAVALNIWGDREVTWTDARTMSEKTLAKELGVQFTPTLLFLDEMGTVALRLNGYQPPERFRLALDYLTQHREASETFTAYLARHPLGVRHARAAPPRIGTRLVDMRSGARTGKPLVVVIEQAECRACDELRETAASRADVKRLLDRFRVGRIDLVGRRTIVAPSGERVREGEWSNALRIVYTPTLVFFDADGREVFRADGYLRPFHLAAALDYVASGAYRDEPSFQRFIKMRAERMRDAGKSVELWD